LKALIIGVLIGILTSMIAEFLLDYFRIRPEFKEEDSNNNNNSTTWGDYE